MSRTASKSSFNADEVRQQHQRVQEQVRTLAQNHEQLMQGLSQEQKDAVQQRNQSLLQTHERIQNRLQEMDQELANPQPNAKRVAEQARATEREMNAYQKEFRAMGDDLSLKND